LVKIRSSTQGSVTLRWRGHHRHPQRDQRLTPDEEARAPLSAIARKNASSSNAVAFTTRVYRVSTPSLRVRGRPV
jgi:hypothetical protein